MIKILNDLRKKTVSLAENFASKPAFTQYLWVALLLLVIITCNLQFIQKAGDAIHKWFALRQLLVDGGWVTPPTHHTLRWMLMLPVALLVKILGDNVYVYYIYPVICYISGGLLYFALIRKLSSSPVMLYGILLYALYPKVIQEGTQFLPMGAALGWIFLTLLLSLYAVESRKWSWLLMLAAGIALGIAYGCKETVFYWAPGIFLYMGFASTAEKPLFSMGRFHLTLGMITFFLGCIGIFIAETIIVNQIFDVRLGRLELVSSSHLTEKKAFSARTASVLEYIFSIFRTLHWNGKYFDSFSKNFSLIISLLSACYIMRYEKAKTLRLLASAFIGAFICHTYIIFRIDPISYPEPPHHRYFTAMIAVGLLLYAMILPGLWQKIKNSKIWIAATVSITVLFLVPVAIYVGNMRINDGNLVQLELMRQTLPAAFANNTPIGVITRKKYLPEKQTERMPPDKWGALYVKLFAEIPQANHILKTGCTYTEYDKKNIIVWLTPYKADQPVILLHEYSIVQHK